MNNTTAKSSITFPTKKILACTGDGSAIAERIRNEYFATYMTPIESGIPIIETKLKYNHENERKPVEQVFMCPLCGNAHIHREVFDGRQISDIINRPPHSKYIMYINDKDYKNSGCAALFEFIRQHHKEVRA